MHPRLAEFSSPHRRRRPWRGVAAVVLLAAAPKCVLCLAGWLGLGALLGLGGPEICGGANSPAHTIPAALLALVLLIAVVSLVYRALKWRRRRPSLNPAAKT